VFALLYRVDDECVTSEVLRIVAVDDVISVGHVTRRVDLAPAQYRPEVVRGACVEQLAATCALGHGEDVVVRGYQVTVETTSLRLVVDRVPDPLRSVDTDDHTEEGRSER